MSYRYLIALVLVASIVRGLGDPADLQQSAVRQEQIRGETRKLVTRLDEVIEDYNRNGLAKGEDFDVLKNVRATLGSLSDEEMEKIVALLTDAGAKPESAPGEIAKAYAGQKDVSLRLKQILAAHERQQDIDALAGAVSQLADRQSANLTTAIDVKQLAAQDKSPNGQTAVSASEEAQQGEQAAIAGEAKLVADKIAKIAGDASEPKYKEAAAQLAAVAPQADAASAALGAGKIDDAIAAETAMREKLKQLALALAPTDKPESAASNSSGQLDGIDQEQKAILAQTTQLNNALKYLGTKSTPDEADKAMLQQLARPTNKLAMQLAAAGITAASPIDQIRKTPEMQKFAAAWSDALKKQGAMINSKMAALAGDQSALATKAQMVREDLDKTVKEASEPMANALTQMNTAQGALAQGDSEQAVQSEADAIAQLEKAAKLADQNSANSAPVQAAGTRQDQLEQLQKAVTDLAARETSSLQEGDAQKTGPTGAAAATEQQNLAAKAQEMQQAAAAQAPEAAPPLQQAVEALNNAGRAMKSGGTPAIAQTAQQNAVQALGNAAEQLGKEAAAAAQGQEQLAALERELQPIKRLIQEQQQVNLSTQKAIDQQRVSLGQAKGLARQEGTVKKDTEALRHVEGTATTVIAPALDKADAAMGDGVAKMDTEGLAQAQPSEGEALAALYKAQDMLADKIQKMAPELGMPLAPPQAVANAETQLGNAQKNVATAAEALTAGQNVNMAKAAGQMNQAAQRTAQADLQPQALPQAAREAIREAEQAAGAAAAAASAGQQEQAQTKTAQAQKALAAAQTALGQMQAGVGGLTPQAGAMLAANQAGQAGQQASQDQGQGQGPQSAQGSQPLANQANQASQQGTGAKEQSWTDQDGAVKRGLQGAHGPGQFLGLPERDRGALQQSQSEKYPQEYGAMIEEYMRGLANDSGGK